MRNAVLAVFAAAGSLAAQQHVSISTEDRGLIYADIYGQGERGVVLAHGGRRSKDNWAPQARMLEKAGFRVLAFDFRGFGQSKGPKQADFDNAPFQLDVLAAVRYLRKAGARHIAVVGGSFGGQACADAVVSAQPGEIERLVELAAAAGNLPAEKLTVPKLIIVARKDANGDGLRLPGIQKSFDRMPQPKQLVVIEGSAHAQFLFETDQGERVMREILRFLSAP
jgi:pimeloyl-ACP methyl ester carboxylesterase